MKQVVGIHHDGKRINFYVFNRNSILSLFLYIKKKETIDLMDNEGKIKELNTHFDDYATQFLTARSTYYVLKVEGKIIINHSKLLFTKKKSNSSR